MIEHHIQREILTRLIHTATLSFSQLRPVGMENSAFMYHLRQLMNHGYVQRAGNGYTLAAKGLTYVDGLSAANHKPRQQPKLIAIIALQNDSGQWLLAERKMQPYIGTLMLISGKRHMAESTLDHAARELREKAGFTDVALSYRGIADIQIHAADGTLITHAVATVHTGTVTGTTLPADTDRMKFVWHDFDSPDEAYYMPGTKELYQWLARHDEPTLTLSVQQL